MDRAEHHVERGPRPRRGPTGAAAVVLVSAAALLRVWLPAEAPRGRAAPHLDRFTCSTTCRALCLATVAWIAIGTKRPLLLRHVADPLFFRPDARVYATPQSLGLAVEEVHFAAPNGPTLHGWWAPARGSARGTVVYCHGNHANLTHHARFVAWLPTRGFNLLLFDYREFGESAGKVSREGAVDDALAAIDFALARDPTRTVVFGHSLGGAVGVVAAARRPAVRAVVAESTFPSYRDAAQCTAPAVGFLASLLVSAGDDPIDAVAGIAPRPLLVIHGTDDRITPVALGRALFLAARAPKQLWIVDGGGHESAWTRTPAAFEERLCSFLADAVR